MELKDVMMGMLVRCKTDNRIGYIDGLSKNCFKDIVLRLKVPKPYNSCPIGEFPGEETVFIHPENVEPLS